MTIPAGTRRFALFFLLVRAGAVRREDAAFAEEDLGVEQRDVEERDVEERRADAAALVFLEEDRRAFADAPLCVR